MVSRDVLLPSLSPTPMQPHCGGSAAALGGVANPLLAVPLTGCAVPDPPSAGKMAGLWMPVTMFVALGLEHSVANMYFLPLGMMTGAEFGRKGTGSGFPIAIRPMFSLAGDRQCLESEQGPTYK